ncbi:hypothetical protein MRB53_021115 [Persea americana]|uniref:Uncharacterized protein n=1 Tax=Persea americana TaxID=3435 RepID=A0ACC2L450_PERAE|nr:hypothetical protein MRB53_021115 [Persea americana]
MATVSDNAPSWADQWGTTEDLEEDNNAKAKEKGGNKKKGDVKAAASLTLDKAKATAAAGANKVKNGTLMSMKWVKSKCQKGTSK